MLGFKYVAALATLLGCVSNVHAFSCSCNGRNYDNSDIFAAINTANEVDPIANPTDQTDFPHRYVNTPTDDYPWCGPGNYAEYPLLPVPPGPYDPRDTMTFVLDAGPDRVVYIVGNGGTFCGCLTNEGQSNPDQLELCDNYNP